MVGVRDGPEHAAVLDANTKGNLMASIKSLGMFDPQEVASIQAIDKQTLLPNVIRSGEIAQFIREHGTVLMAHSREGDYYHNAQPVSGFTSIILKAR